MAAVTCRLPCTHLQVVKCKTVVAGNSIGGFIATSMAADYPELVSGLILLNRCVANRQQGKWKERYELQQIILCHLQRW